MLQDLRFGLKLLWKQKAFTLAALLTLALCIGANTAIFTVLDGIVLRGLPYPQSDRLVTLFNTYPGVGVEHGSNSVPDYGDRRKLTDVFDDVALFGSSGYDVGLQGSPRRINGQYVTPSYFHILGVQPLLGRTFTEQEAVRGKEKVAILSEGLWKEMFSGDRGVLGKDIRLTGELYRIVGVMPDGFGVYGNDPRLWVPFAFEPRQTSDDARHSNSWSMIARLRPGVSLAYAQQRIHALNKAITDRFPKLKPLLENARFATRVVGLKDEMVRDIRPTLYLLQAAVAVVLLIGCVNLANLMLVRSQVRLKELGIRSALGAGRRRLGRQLLTESVALALLGGALGLGVGFGSVRLLARLGASELPRAAEIRIDGGVLAFTAAIAVLTGLIFGSVPLVHLFKRDLNQVFRENDRAGTLGVRAVWVRSALVVSQVSLAFVLLIGSALLTLSFLKLLDVDPGFRSEDVITARFSLPANRYSDDARARTLTSGLLDRLRSLPGVRHAGVTTFLPFSGEGNASVAMIEGYTLAPGENPPVPGWNTVDSGYFAAMGIPLIEGRYFNGSDSEGARKVVIIDQFLARKYWRGRSPLGGRLLRGIEKKENEFATIVGVIGSVNTGDLADRSERGQIYFHYPQYVPRTMHVVL
ncbi:MAG: ABC transporter permease, partial [Acidobacteria bacterium]|nr:ABC transporter permease [Acidobacteriota bacterium]